MPDMRFAPPAPVRIADRASGLNAGRVRSHNERLILSMLLRSGELTRAQIGERSELSGQTVSVLIRSLQQEGLLSEGERMKSRMGPPTVPLTLNPEGAFAVGVDLDPRGASVALVDFLGRARALVASEPDTASIVAAVAERIDALSAARRKRLAGVGLAVPEPPPAYVDLAKLTQMLERETGLDVFVQDDITAAAGGESLYGEAKAHDTYLLFHIGDRVYSMLTLDRQTLRSPRRRSYPHGLLDLEERLQLNGPLTVESLSERAAGDAAKDVVADWIEDCVRVLTERAKSAAELIDFTHIVVSATLPEPLLERICTRLEQDLPGFTVAASGNGPASKAIGAATLPFITRFV
ncbi:ROK family transcriptional regulator [Oceanibium sediminis]|uniref:ROK family transcriptional regulator n=1 Tax=Oceanibium sediminis TaxID=2026339 RepID=UPI000DD3474E|nr:ROK family transcriptional regulator [Oceanibium sediminis]